jgi:hypothetical protein
VTKVKKRTARLTDAQRAASTKRVQFQMALYVLTEYESDVIAAMPADARVFDLDRVRAALRKLAF